MERGELARLQLPPRGAELGTPMLAHFAAEEGHATLQLIKPIHAIFNADPAVEADRFEG